MSRQADEVQHVKSHSERRIFEGCIMLMQSMCYEIAEYLSNGWTPDGLFEHDYIPHSYYFEFDIHLTEIVYELFLSHTAHSGMPSRLKKLRELGYTDDDVKRFVIRVPKPDDK